MAEKRPLVFVSATRYIIRFRASEATKRRDKEIDVAAEILAIFRLGDETENCTNFLAIIRTEILTPETLGGPGVNLLGYSF